MTSDQAVSRPMQQVLIIFQEMEEAISSKNRVKADLLAAILKATIDKALGGVPVEFALKASLEQARAGTLEHKAIGSSSQAIQYDEPAQEAAEPARKQIDVLSTCVDLGVGIVSWVAGMGLGHLVFGKP